VTEDSKPAFVEDILYERLKPGRKKWATITFVTPQRFVEDPDIPEEHQIPQGKFKAIIRDLELMSFHSQCHRSKLTQLIKLKIKS